MILAVNHRAETDDLSIGELFWLLAAEVAEVSFSETFNLILNALLNTVREFFTVSDEQMEAFTQRFLSKLSVHLRSAFGWKIAASVE